MSKQRILVVDDLAIFREPIAMALRSEGYHVDTAEDGHDALHVVERSVMPFDLMIVDYSMPNLDGLSFVQKAIRYAHMNGVPSIMLTDMADKEIVIAALKVGIKDYVLKSAFSLPDLMEKVKKNISEAKAPDTAVKTMKESVVVTEPGAAPQVFLKLKQFLASNPVPQSIHEIMALVESGDSQGVELAKAIEAEPLLASRILKLANSSAYQRSGRAITSVHEAVTKIGYSAIRNMATSSFFCVFDSEKTAEWQGMLSYHAYAVSVFMDRLCHGTSLASSAHLVGLCHDLPELIIGFVYPEQYQQALQACNQDQVTFRKVLAERLGVSYLELAELVFDELALPGHVKDIVLQFYGQRSQGVALHDRLCAALTVAHSYANSLGFSAQSDSLIDLFSGQYVVNAIGSAAALHKLAKGIKREVCEVLESFGIPTPRALRERTLLKLKVKYVACAECVTSSPVERWISDNCMLLSSTEEPEEVKLEIADCLVITSIQDAGNAQSDGKIKELIARAIQFQLPVVCLANDMVTKAGKVTGVHYIATPFVESELRSYLARLALRN